MTLCPQRRNAWTNSAEVSFLTYYRYVLLEPLFSPYAEADLRKRFRPPQPPPAPQTASARSPRPLAATPPLRPPRRRAQPPAARRRSRKNPESREKSRISTTSLGLAAPPAPSATPPSAGGRAEVWLKNVG